MSLLTATNEWMEKGLCMEIARTNGDGTIHSDRLVVPVKYWIGAIVLIAAMTASVVIFLHTSLKSLETKMDAQMKLHVTELHAHLYRPKGNETVNEALEAIRAKHNTDHHLITERWQKLREVMVDKKILKSGEGL